MTQDNKILAIIADPSPVIAAGLAQCLRRLQGFTAGAIEVKTTDELSLRTRTTCPDFLLVNPSFGGLFNPIQWKREMKLPDVKILAIEIGKLNPETAGLFDGVISVMDDLETISRKLQSLREPLDNSRDTFRHGPHHLCDRK
ncbi:MAG: hypothetical protein K2H15_05725 [Muribaculaceae bacterium]|nr:hypothetical protein [Muribaculaceae bacterium]